MSLDRTGKRTDANNVALDLDDLGDRPGCPLTYNQPCALDHQRWVADWRAWRT